MGRAWKVCAALDCPELVPPHQSRCDGCGSEADRARGTATQRGYTSAAHRAFRREVFRKNPICVLCQVAPSKVADHYPISRRDLVAAGADPNDPASGRGLCKPCHDRHTALHEQRGWDNRRQ